jgi:hypothetical protein
MTTTPPAEPGPDLLDAALAAQLGRPLYDRINRHLADGQRAQAALERIRAVAPTPYRFVPSGHEGRMYARGWQAALEEVTLAAAECCVCGGAPVVYRNFKEQPFCGPCANCECGQDVCVRTRPDTRPGPSGGHVRTADVAEQPPTSHAPVTSADTVRTHPDTDTPDTSDPGVRIEYRARVRRNQVHLAIAEAFDVISRETDR